MKIKEKILKFTNRVRASVDLDRILRPVKLYTNYSINLL